MAQSSGIELPKLQMDFRNHPPNQGPYGLRATSTFPNGGRGKWNYVVKGEGMLGWIPEKRPTFCSIKVLQEACPEGELVCSRGSLLIIEPSEF